MPQPSNHDAITSVSTCPEPQAARLGRGFLLVNLVTQGGGQAIAMALSLLALPIYLHAMGAEGLGLIGFAALVSALVRVFDLGMTSSVSRRLAQIGAERNANASASDFVKTFQVLFLCSAVFIMLGLVAAYRPITQYSLKQELFGETSAFTLIVLIAVLVAGRWCGGFYHACLLGMEQQRKAALILVIDVCLQHGGAVALLLWVTRDVGMYFLWMASVSLLFALGSGIMVWRQPMLRGVSGRFHHRHITQVWRFALGVTGLTVASMVLTQMDRLVANTLFTLTQFGHYTTAIMASGAISAVFIMPMLNTIYPRFSALVTHGDEESLRHQYVFASMILQALILPTGILGIMHGQSMMWVWTQDAVLMEQVGPLLGWLVLGVALNALIVPAFALQLAHGWTVLATGMCAVMIVISLPLFVWAGQQYGLEGVAVALLVIHGLNSLITLPITHRYYLQGLIPRLVVRGYLPVVAGSVLYVGVLYVLPLPVEPRWLAVLMIMLLTAIGWGITIGFCALWSGETHLMLRLLKGIIQRTAAPWSNNPPPSAP